MWTWAVSEESRNAGAVVQLTDAERVALARIRERGENGLTLYEATGTYGLDREACISLGRFGLVTDRYPERQVRQASKVNWLSMAGRARFESMHGSAVRTARGATCCEHMILLPCVCLYKSHCPIHGGGCYGSHD